MRSFLFGRQRQLVYDYRVGLAKSGRGPIAQFAIVSAVFLLAGTAGALSGAVSTHTSSKANAQAPLTPTNSVPKLKFATQPLISPIGDDSYLDGIIANFAQTSAQFKWSVAVQGLDQNTVDAAYNADQSYVAASIYKLLLMYPLSQKLPYPQWPTTQLRVGSRNMSIQDCVTVMLKVSDNACGLAVGHWVGWAYADAQLKSLGLTSTTLNGSGGPITTASDTTKYLAKLWNSNSFGSDLRQFILKTMSLQTLRGGIPTGCSACNVADKTGDLGSLRHDAGIIYAGDKSYILSIFTSGASYAQIAQLTAQIQSYMASLR
jgi:beta-lactamase class A